MTRVAFVMNKNSNLCDVRATTTIYWRVCVFVWASMELVILPKPYPRAPLISFLCRYYPLD